MPDIARLRAETPGCADNAFFDNAGSSLPPEVVTRTVIDHLLLEQRTGGYAAAAEAAERTEAVYASIARLIGAARGEIALVENATRAWDMAFYAIPFRPGDRILTTRSEYPSNALAFRQAVARHGVRVEVVPDDEHGQISLDHLAAMLADGGVRLVAINHVPTYNGLVNPAAEVGRLARAAGALFLLDACQAVGQLPVDVTETGCDMLSATGRKFLRGPRGTGFLYVRREVIEQLDPPMLDLWSATWTGPDTYTVRPDAGRFETWERNVAAQLGLGAAVDYALALGTDVIRRRVAALADRLRDGLGRIPGATVRDRGLVRSGIVTFTDAGGDARRTVDRLRAAGITTGVAHPARAHFDEGPHRPAEVVRASVHYYNTEAEVDRLLTVLADD